ncbi:hypothetical protein CRYUN_Cryun02cG0161100 [Craigia yunnanensis]
MSIFSPPFSVPPGHRFCPTKTEILCSYLRPAINGELLPSNTLIERGIYGENKEPWNVFDKDKQCSFWVFTKLKKKSKSRIDRTAGSGTWLGRSIKEVKDERGQFLGFDKYFTFTCKKNQSNRGRDGNWIMHEFSLSDQGLSDYVICEIKNKNAVGSDDDQDNPTAKSDDYLDNPTAEVEAINQKQKALELVNDEEMSVPTVKKICVDERNINQGNAEWNGSTLTTNQEIFRELNGQENHDPNQHLMIGSNSHDEACEWSDMDLASLINELK